MKLLLYTGRVARAGRAGRAYSLVSSDEAPYVIDLHLFLGRSINTNNGKKREREREAQLILLFLVSDGVFGSVPHVSIEDENELILKIHANNEELVKLDQNL